MPPQAGCGGNACDPATVPTESDCCDGYKCIYSAGSHDSPAHCTINAWSSSSVIPMPTLELLYMVGALLVVVLCTVNITCCLMRKRWGNTEGKRYEAVRVYDSEDQIARIPIKMKGGGPCCD